MTIEVKMPVADRLERVCLLLRVEKRRVTFALSHMGRHPQRDGATSLAMRDPCGSRDGFETLRTPTEHGGLWDGAC